jgi:hypothetical protein
MRNPENMYQVRLHDANRDITEADMNCVNEERRKIKAESSLTDAKLNLNEEYKRQNVT